MTIALGILARDGIVIAADTQEGSGYAGDIKTSVRKIASIKIALEGHDLRAVGVTGAGSAGFLDALHQQLLDAFPHDKTQEKYRAAVRRLVREFYRDHVLPAHVLGQYRPDVEVIVGTTWKGGMLELLATDLSTVRHCKEYVAVGAGAGHATMLLSQILPPAKAITVQVAQHLAAYTVWHVKEYIEGCGKNTHLLVLRGGSASYVSQDNVRLLEQHFTAHSRFEALALSYALGRPLKDETEGLTHLLGYLRSVRKDVQDLSAFEVTSSDWDLDWNDRKKKIGPSATIDMSSVVMSVVPAAGE